MKVGDKVILRKFETNPILQWVDGLSKYVDEVVEVLSVEDSDGTFSIRDEDFLLSEWWWLQSACDLVTPNQTLKNERYFFFSYVSDNSTGNISMKNTESKIPSNLFVVEHLKKEHLLNKVAITNIFEFKSEKDFLDFTNE